MVLISPETPRTSQDYGIDSPLKPLEHRSTMVLRGSRGALNCAPIMPRVARTADVIFNYFQLEFNQVYY